MRRFHFQITIVLVVFLYKTSFSQNDNSESWRYLYQIPPNDTAKVFAPGIVSTKSLEHSAPTFSPDGTEIYWSRIDFPLNENIKKIMFVKYKNNTWTEPQTASFSGTFTDDSPFYSYDGERIYFSSDRRKIINTDTLDSKRWTLYSNSDIWFVEKFKTRWKAPLILESPITTPMLEGSISLTEKGNIYFLTHLEGVSQECGIYFSERINNNYTKPSPLPESINSKSQDWTPFIARNESYIIFSSARNKSRNDYGDLYISFKEESNTWSEPIDMGDKINTWAQERFPVVSPDGKYLFFTRWTKENHHDIFWVDAGIITELRSIVIR